MLPKYGYFPNTAIRIQEPPDRYIIEPASEVVQPRFLIVDIAAIAERVALAQRRCQRTSGGNRLAPCVVLVFYYKRARIVKQSDDVALPKQSLMFFPVLSGRAADIGLEHP